ncbi:MAG: nitroreductase [Sphingomonadales bacterium 63-6]|nr:MAG: nitroreductase [Sphingomonadales bacterium 63-6]
MDLKQAILTRRAVREYLPDPLPERQIQALIDLAIEAPSAMNRQPWAFCVVRDPAILQHVSDKAKAHMLQSVPPVAGSENFNLMLGSSEFHIFYHAPALVLISATQDDNWSHLDCALAAENLMLAAAAEGLGSCWIGFAQGWLNTPEGKAFLSLPPSHVPIAPIILGRPLHGVPPVARNRPDIRWIG